MVMMKFLARPLASLACICAFGVMTLAQTPAGAPQNNASQPPKKSNERPAAAEAAEPFDGASVEKMAAQCVRLETEAGLIELEMLAETAPETVRNFLNLT